MVTEGSEQKRGLSQSSSVEAPSSYKKASEFFFTPSPDYRSRQSFRPSEELKINLVVAKLQNVFNKSQKRLGFVAISDSVGRKI
jgi:hypothetical protein